MTDRAAILMAIKPQWWDLIRAGQKTVELRRVTPKDLVPGMPIVWYVSAPVSAIAGEAECERVSEGLPIASRVPERFAKVKMSWEDACEYWHGAHKPCAIWLREVREYPRLRRLAGGKLIVLGRKPPQSFCYLTAAQLAAIRAAGMEAD